ncbi:MAG: hypothetical protein ABIN94_20855 [Ferruginibacter sp.]
MIPSFSSNIFDYELQDYFQNFIFYYRSLNTTLILHAGEFPENALLSAAYATSAKNWYRGVFTISEMV